MDASEVDDRSTDARFMRYLQDGISQWYMVETGREPDVMHMKEVGKKTFQLSFNTRVPGDPVITMQVQVWDELVKLEGAGSGEVKGS